MITHKTASALAALSILQAVPAQAACEKVDAIILASFDAFEDIEGDRLTSDSLMATYSVKVDPPVDRFSRADCHILRAPGHAELICERKFDSEDRMIMELDIAMSDLSTCLRENRMHSAGGSFAMPDLGMTPWRFSSGSSYGSSQYFLRLTVEKSE